MHARLVVCLYQRSEKMASSWLDAWPQFAHRQSIHFERSGNMI
jgi:hypothetical protein